MAKNKQPVIARRNPYAVPAKAAKGGPHGKTRKAQRRAQKVADARQQ